LGLFLEKRAQNVVTLKQSLKNYNSFPRIPSLPVFTSSASLVALQGLY
jgi:hypothetical protein